MDLGEIHNYIDFILRKNQGGYLTPPEKDRILNRAQYDLFEELKPAFGSSQQVHDYLKPFLKKLTLINSNTTSGVVTFPTDYYHLLAISVVVTNSDSSLSYCPVEQVNIDELDKRRSSALTPVDVKHPIGDYAPSGTFQIYPAAPVAGAMMYLRKPADCVYAYSMSANRPIYDQSGSTQLEWNEPATNKIIYMALEGLGLGIQDVNAVQWAQSKEAAK